MTCKFPFSHVNCGIKLCIICQKSNKPCVLLFKKFCCLIWLVISCLVKILLDCICWPSNRITCRIRGSAPLLAWYVISQMFYCYNRCTFEKFGIWSKTSLNIGRTGKVYFMYIKTRWKGSVKKQACCKYIMMEKWEYFLFIN